MFSRGMRIFLTIWFGQFMSWVGTGMTRFALLFWAYQQTEQATTVAMLGFSAFVPLILVGPFAGVWVDRLDRRLVMLLSDLGAGLVTVCLLLLFFTGQLEIWHLYVAEAFAGLFEAFQMPAYTAATTVLIPKDQYVRAAGLRSVADYGSQIAAPVLAGLLLVAFDITTILLVDLATFLIAAVTLLFIQIPAHREAADGDGPTPSFFSEFKVGFRYIWDRPGLLGLLGIMTGINFFAALTYFAIMPAMILARSGGDEIALASVQAMLGGFGVVGGVLLSIWGGPRRKIDAMLLATAVSFLFGDLLFAIGRNLTVWMIAASVAAFFIPFIVGAYRTIWQIKVPPALQGRVLSVAATVQQSLMPIGYLIAGPIADQWLEPAMQPDGALAPSLGWLVGVGPGSGMALMFLFTAVFGCLVGFSGYLFPAVRNVERDLPDFDA